MDRKVLAETGRLIAAKCAEFGVEGEIAEYHPGPVVTTYEFRPAAGIKVNQVMGLSEDLALALSAESIRVERLPGRASVGIEVPNPGGGEIIAMRDVIESERFKRSPSLLTLALGKDIHGEPVVDDLRAMPHLLIAGTTGSGKSVGINSLITSILYKAPPDQVKLILIDPKMVELEIYENLPHLATPDHHGPQEGGQRPAVGGRADGGALPAALGLRPGPQRRAVQRGDQGPRAPWRACKEQHPEDPDLKLEPMPLIVIIIDELADLMMTAPKDVEESIVRIAQKARAVGIHLVVATQRPSVDVLTGVIKANLPSRIAFKVSSKIDSRVILDGNGAERLLGRGDMLFLPPGTSRLKRVHGAYVSVQETAQLVKFLRKQAKPQFDEEITKDRDESVSRDDARRRDRSAVRRGGAPGGAGEDGVDLLPAAAHGRRLLARRQAHRHDVPRRPARPAARLQAPRGPRRGGLLRGSGPAAAMTRAMRSLVLAFDRGAVPSCTASTGWRGGSAFSIRRGTRSTSSGARSSRPSTPSCSFSASSSGLRQRVAARLGRSSASSTRWRSSSSSASGVLAARRLWKMRHPAPGAAPAAGAEDPADPLEKPLA